ncbi:phosphate-responsive 1 family protein [Actinidia rufa]|uniref:Phosphate-responsive 1 family protein n=1 Tax=Actinidia rufa TaxID=165716 RepID=A0A7J0EHK4_9ERIC|nr:phosphate-responsive 1 family protein [Actinidia rufa]
MCLGARKLTSLYNPPPMTLTYHNGALLEGDLHVSIIWYGKFSPSQKSIVVDFLLSLNPSKVKTPSVSQWWQTINLYMKEAGKKETHVVITNQINDENCSMGKTLKKSQIAELTHRVNSKPGGLTLVLTADDVAVEGFCMSCGFHGSGRPRRGRPLGAPNGDVGLDGMIVNIASLLAGTVTNPYGDGYFQGSAGAPLEAASACVGAYGNGAYPGYAGEVLADVSTGASYNALGANGRKYLVPALFNLYTSQCSTMV